MHPLTIKTHLLSRLSVHAGKKENDCIHPSFDNRYSPLPDVDDYAFHLPLGCPVAAVCVASSVEHVRRPTTMKWTRFVCAPTPTPPLYQLEYQKCNFGLSRRKGFSLY